MKTAIEMIMGQSSDILMNKIQAGNVSSEKEMVAIVEQSMKQPVCSRLSIRLYQDEKIDGLMIDSIQWDVIPMPSRDTAKKTNRNTYYPNRKDKQDVYLQWRSFADIILTSGLLK